MEAQYVRNKFHVIRNEGTGAIRLRCVYCESDVEQFVVASKKNKWFTRDAAPLLRTQDQHFNELVVFAGNADAIANGFHIRRGTGEPRPAAEDGSKVRRKARRGV
jgi:hypothetical protein